MRYGRSSRAQSSLEFVVLAGFMLLFFMFIIVGIQSRMVSAQVQRNEAIAFQVARAVNNEAVLASSVHEGYERPFFLPLLLDGSEYNMVVEGTDDMDLVVSFRGKDYIFFLDAPLTLSEAIRPGWNTVLSPP
jgi:hypothetical protein